jgi:hypothetical protein
VLVGDAQAKMCVWMSDPQKINFGPTQALEQHIARLDASLPNPAFATLV